MKRKSILFILICLVSAACFAGCSHAAKREKTEITVTLLNGEHYEVVGDCKKAVADGNAAFEISLERGFAVADALGDTLSVTDDPSFTQTVTFTDVKYKTVARLETRSLDTFAFSVEHNDEFGAVDVDSALGTAELGKYYENDVVDVTAGAKDGYRFVCWSKNNYISDGGEFLSYDSSLGGVDFKNTAKLFANFKLLSDTKNTVVYRFDGGVEIEQDCSALLAHHARANTYTAAEAKALGVDFGGKHLAGWKTESGERVGLGSRVTVKENSLTALYPDFKEYTQERCFTVNESGVLTAYTGDGDSDEIVIPERVGGMEVKTIGGGAFENCSAKAYYLPDTVTTVQNNAFLNCTELIDFYMPDSVMEIDDKAFTGCKNFKSLHLNAVLAPRRMDYNSVKSEVYDSMIVNADSGKRKLVILAGSSARYGYCTKVINELFEQSGFDECDVYNLGCAADMGGYCQYEMVLNYLRSEDIFLHAPEHWDFSWCGTLSLSQMTKENEFKVNYRIFHVTECNWDLLSYITVNRYSNIFQQYSNFNKSRSSLSPKSYADYFKTVDDDSLGFRHNTEGAFNENGIDKNFGANGKRTFANLDDSINIAREMMYDILKQKGVKTYVSFPPINRHNLLLTYADETAIKESADAYTQRVKDVLADTGVKVIADQYSTVYDGRHFYNSDYHLGDPFRNEHTTRIISALLESLASESATEASGAGGR